MESDSPNVIEFKKKVARYSIILLLMAVSLGLFLAANENPKNSGTNMSGTLLNSRNVSNSSK